jgi:ceramide glucosyltransferase
LSNATLWPLLWLALDFGGGSLAFCLGALLVRVLAALHLQRRLNRAATADRHAWLVPVKDLLQFALWLGAFAGNRIQWRGETYHLRRDGTMARLGKA